MIDTHAHIYDIKFAEDRANVIERAAALGIKKILMPNCAEETIEPMLQCEKDFPDICFPMMGLHPCYVIDTNVQQELKLVENYLEKRKFCAVGEIGLDYYWDKTFVEDQKKAFHVQIELALHYNLPIVVHSRESTADCIELISPYIAKGLKGVLHCYSGTLQEAKQLIDLDFMLGIGGVLTYKKSGLHEVVQNLPLSHLLLETDAPYLAPTPHRGKRNECAYMIEPAQLLADMHQLPLLEIDAITTENAMRLFKNI
jgi:TatD DNase family protein